MSRSRLTRSSSLTSMDRAWLTDALTLEAGVSLSECSFDATTGLDLIRPTGRAFDNGPMRRQRLAQDLTWWKRRKADGGAPAYSQLASWYRQLRVGLEKAGNIPGGHDFYYGEMENRRKAAWPARPAEYSILSAYKLISGYGLRAWRAFACYATVVAAAMWGFHRNGGFAPYEDEGQLGFWETLDYALRASTSFLRPEGRAELELDERYVQLGLRVAAPIILALAFLAVRNRVKR